MESSFDEFVSLSVDNRDDVDKIFKSIIHYLTDLSRNRSKPNGLHIPGMINKLLLAGKFYKVEDFLLVELNGIMEGFSHCLAQLHIDPPQVNLFEKTTSLFSRRNIVRGYREMMVGYNRDMDRVLVELNALVWKIYNAIQVEYSKESELTIINKFLDGRNVEKIEVKGLLFEAINLINTDYTLSIQVKKNILDFLYKALNELEKPSTNWTVFFGVIKEAVIVISAASAILSGAADVIQLLEAQNKIEKIDKTYLNATKKDQQEYIKYLLPPVEPNRALAPAKINKSNDR